MRSFSPDFIARQPISQRLLQTIRLIGEHKGRHALYRDQSPQLLKTLREAAIIQSTESSNRIEGVTAPPERIKALVESKTTPKDRSEQEIAGYRDVLQTIHANAADMKFNVGLVLQMHRDLFRHTTEEGGRWKSSANEIAELRPDGSKFIRFQPVAPHLTEDAMRELHERFNLLWESRQVERLLLIPAYVLDFLCIHPFRDGNGRLARLVSLLLLYQAGYEVGRYVSLELLVEQTREQYYETLYRSSQNWHEAKHSLQPWTEYFLGVVLSGAYRQFEDRAGLVSTAKGSKSAMVLDIIGKFRAPFSISQLKAACPTVGTDLIRRILQEEKRANRIEPTGRGPKARWRRKK